MKIADKLYKVFVVAGSEPLGRSMMTKLHVYAGPEHDNAAQKPEVLEIKF